MKQSKTHIWSAFSRRHFIKTILGFLGCLAAPVRAKPDKKNSHASLREADFYRPEVHCSKKKKE